MNNPNNSQEARDHSKQMMGSKGMGSGGMMDDDDE